MRYAREFMIIMSVSFVGEVLNDVLPLPVPASIYGLVLMLLCLCSGLIRLEWVQDTANFLVVVMPLMFIPAAAGLLDVWDVIQPILFPLIVITILTTLIDIFAAGWVSQLIIRHRRKRHE
jgi:holin-like protein